MMEKDRCFHYHFSCHYISKQEPCCFFFFFGGAKTARIALSKTSFKPCLVNAEHSRYFIAPISLAKQRPWSIKENKEINDHSVNNNKIPGKIGLFVRNIVRKILFYTVST